MKENPAYYAIIPSNVRYDEELSPNAKLLYGEISALCNQHGYCWASNEYFASLYKVSKISISKWVNQLKEKGYVFVKMNYKPGTKEILNRHISLVEYPIKEKFNTSITKVKEPIKEKFKDNITINNTTNNIEHLPDAEDKSSLTSRFESIWDYYPKGRKQGKEKAFKSYKKAIQEGTTDQEIIKGIESYKKQIKLQQTELKFIKQGSTWFNNKCWNDEYITKQSNKPNQLEYVDVPEEFR
ncbi:helix-turn-helix domain-containing protein [Vagococcus fluvialis]|uniref:helix-turn-helix domain-containing protein n=1 Tax=Vagococcus fluvialis TaxID=2738 RepID=UPI00288CC5BF|nr:helix-turn-helix domain-containing protein [Vagococcus fluvialis]MDT2781408.1 helix-turn-helix domain-containing protein [Vagococcus fluvialis]